MPTRIPGLQVVSDLHLEFHQDYGRGLLESLAWSPAGSAVVLAGDIGSVDNQAATLDLAFQFFSTRFEAVFYLPGNHEYYGSRAPSADDALRRLVTSYPKVTLLEPGVEGRWGDRQVVGATLWFGDGPSNRMLSRQLSDFSAIKEFTPWVYRQSTAHRAWLEESVREGTVVVTHHLPSERSVAPRFRGDPLNAFFVCAMDELIEAKRPALWIHGHTHDSCDYQLGSTRVVANPYGYPKEENPGYRTLVLPDPEGS